MSFLRSRLLGGSSLTPLYAPPGEAGGGGGDGGVAGAAAAAAAAAAAGGGAADQGKGGADKTLAGGAADLGGAAAAAAAAAAGDKTKLPDGFDFRGYLAAGDKDAAKDLEKYTDPRAIYKSLRGLQDDISSGKFKRAPEALPENATPEQTAEWRKSNGLPESAEAMVKGLKLPDGVVPGEADKPLIEQFAKGMFEQGATQGEMDRAITLYYGLQDGLEEQRTENDGKTRIASEVALRGEMGADYTANMNAMGSVLAMLPEGVADGLLTARDADGNMLGNRADVIKALAQLGRELNPAATLVLPGGGDAKTIDAEMATIEKSMYDKSGAPNRVYWGDEKAQARYRELLDVRLKMQQKGGSKAA
jgi:hypothetical protein